MGAEYGVTAIWYFKQKSRMVTEFGKLLHECDTGQSALPTEDKSVNWKQCSPSNDNNWCWTSTTLPELWNDGEVMEYTYHASTYKDTATICKVSPIIIQDLNSTKCYGMKR